MREVSRFPREIAEIENVFIPLKDGTKLAARIWLPKDAGRDPVPAILEYLPYRKRDRTSDRDQLTHPYFAGHGYAAVRVDLRGSGDSEGVLKGEYLEQEQDDALDVLDWLEAQPWCSGAIGMIGISWGGFNGLQIAARRHRALKAVVSICSTDDRYADDIHFMGGCLLLDKISWYSTMFSLNTAPPDPELVGEKWRKMWMARLEGSGFWLKDWLEHQRRDEFYEHGSVCEDWDAIQCPVYAVGGWADGYSNAVFRLLANLKCPKKGLIGPWAHKYPHFAKPGPQIGFLQECIRWWDQWLKGKDTGIMAEPIFRMWMEDPAPPQANREYSKGRWIAEESWPSNRIEEQRRVLLPHRLGQAGEKPQTEAVQIHPWQTVGLAAGRWCPYGAIPDLPRDQREEEGGQVLFDSRPLVEDLEIAGFPRLDLTLSSDRPNAIIAATLCEIMADGRVSRVSYGVLNLTHRNGHETPEALTPGVPVHVQIQLNGTAHRFAKGNRIRVALSTAYWPIIWPSPAPATLTLDLSGSSLVLPVRPPVPEDKRLPEFPPAEHAPALKPHFLEPEANGWTICHDVLSGITKVRRIENEGVRLHEGHEMETGAWRESEYAIEPGDPLSAKVDIAARRRYARKEWSVASATRIEVAASETDFLVKATLEAFEQNKSVFARSWSLTIPRDHV
jgi:putative CocE/NonD family hydrolase